VAAETLRQNGHAVNSHDLYAEQFMVFNTANTPDDRERAIFGDPLATLWQRCVFDLCGVKEVRRRTFAMVVTSMAAQRAAWLQEVRVLVAAGSPPGQVCGRP